MLADFGFNVLLETLLRAKSRHRRKHLFGPDLDAFEVFEEYFIELVVSLSNYELSTAVRFVDLLHYVLSVTVVNFILIKKRLSGLNGFTKISLLVKIVDRELEVSGREDIGVIRLIFVGMASDGTGSRM